MPFSSCGLGISLSFGPLFRPPVPYTTPKQPETNPKQTLNPARDLVYEKALQILPRRDANANCSICCNYCASDPSLKIYLPNEIELLLVPRFSSWDVCSNFGLCPAEASGNLVLGKSEARHNLKVTHGPKGIVSGGLELFSGDDWLWLGMALDFFGDC